MELERCETIIERGLKTFLEVGTALAQVRDLRLYRGEYDTFEAYCDERWGLKRQRAYELMNAANVVRQMSEISDIPAPERESHAAALAQLKDPDQQRQAWKVARQRAHDLGKRITAALVEAVVRELQHPPAAAIHVPPTADADNDAALAPLGQAAAPATELVQSPVQLGAVQRYPQDLRDLDDQNDDHLIGEGEPADVWPDDLAGLVAALEQQGYELAKESEVRLTYRRPADEAVVTVVKPPAPDVLRLRVVTHSSTDWSDVAERLALVGVQLDTPRSGHLPKYPETQRAYGTLDLNTAQLDEVTDLQRRLVAARTIIEEYQEHITRAQNYKPTSERGEAVSPLLRALERVWLILQEKQDI
jgi:hypothetical protein